MLLASGLCIMFSDTYNIELSTFAQSLYTQMQMRLHLMWLKQIKQYYCLAEMPRAILTGESNVLSPCSFT